MDADQFKEFLTAFTNQQQQFLEKLLPVTASNDSQSNVQLGQSNVNPVLLQPFENFDSKKESFKYYRQRFENYLSMKQIISNKELCSKMFLNSIGATNYNMLAALVSPKNPKELSYDEIIKTFESHLCPKKNVVVAQHKFLSTYQSEHESISEYIATLRRDITECEFISPCECHISIAEIFLRAQFIRGIKDNFIREQILQSDVDTFDEISKKALVLEASKIDCKQLSDKSSIVSNENDIRKITRNMNFERRSENRHRSGSQTQINQRSKSQSRIDYAKLGIKNLCLRCGRNNHTSKNCRINRNLLKCAACKIEGHVEKVCIRTLLDKKRNNTTNANKTNYISDEEDCCKFGVNKILDIFQHKNKDSRDHEKFYVTVYVEGHKEKFEVDSGAGYTFIPRDKFQKLNISVPLQKPNVAFRSYTGDVFLADGKAEVNVEYKGKQSREELYVVPNEFDALLGRMWIRHLRINLQDIDSKEQGSNYIAQVKSENEFENIVSKYPEIFQENVGCIPGVKVSLQLRKNSKPVFHKARDVPYALRDKVNRELDSLESQGIITKISTSDWGSPLVVIPKSDGNVRLCADYKVGVNERLVNTNYPIRQISEILNELRNAKYFCRLDLFKAYLHVLVDEESSLIQALSTHRGIYRVNRLSFGIKNAPCEFNRIIDQILEGLLKTLSYYDDIIVYGSTKEECMKNLDLCLQRLKKYDLHLNRNKCAFFQERIEYLGHIIEFNKISKSPEKVRAILEMPRPTNVDELRRFLGMVTYYSRFLPNHSSTTYALRKLLKKNYQFKWNASCEAAFIRLKDEIASDKTLTPYDPMLPIILTCDASPVGISGVLAHEINGEERPIAFASRSLTPSEQNYSQIDREALAIVFSVNHFFQYLYGRKFKLVTDNKPLTRIFHPRTKLPPMTLARLLRYAAFLSAFDYEVVFKKGEDNIDADCLSRAPVAHKKSSGDMVLNSELNQICQISINAISTELINDETIRKATDSDLELSKFKEELQHSSECPYEFTLDEGILFRGQRVVIPETLQKLVLEELHRTHIGITKMKQLARRYVYWKGIDKDIERIARTCESCAEVKSNPSKVPVHPWDEPQENWERIHIDYAGQFQNHYFLIVVDAKSKWAEIKICKNDPTSASTIEKLSDIFSTHGYPCTMVSDNAKIFTSDEFKAYCNTNGIFQKFIAPGHPATNGLAERYVQILKSRLKAMVNENLSLHTKVRDILFRYRATPLSNGKTPAELYLQRNIRIKFDAFRPKKFNKNIDHHLTSRQLCEEDRVQARCYIRNQVVWKFGTITKKFGKLHYLVKLDDGYVFKRHINQLRKTEIKKKSVSFAPDTESDEITQQQAPDLSFLQQCDDASSPPSQTNSPVTDTHSNPARPDKPDDQLRRSSRQHHPPAYLRDYVLD